MEPTSDQYIMDLNETIERLEERSTRIRKWIVKMIHEAGSGHPGGSLSSTDIMTVLFFHFMKVDPENPTWPDRDRFVLSKGHAAPAYYATLAQRGFFPEEELMSLRKLGSRLQGHPSMRALPGIDMSTGSLGQGLSAAIGMALAGRIDRKDYHVYCIVGDGEVQEGQIWEASMSAAHYKLDNLCVFLDRNNLQIDGPTEKVMGIEPIASKFEAFGYHVIEINGHDHKAIINAVNEAHRTHGKPTMVIAHTVKGKGVSFMEGNLSFHGKAPNDEQLVQALEELGGDI